MLGDSGAHLMSTGGAEATWSTGPIGVTNGLSRRTVSDQRVVSVQNAMSEA
jgi:hypothetical protein